MGPWRGVNAGVVPIPMRCTAWRCIDLHHLQAERDHTSRPFSFLLFVFCLFVNGLAQLIQIDRGRINNRDNGQKQPNETKTEEMRT